MQPKYSRSVFSDLFKGYLMLMNESIFIRHRYTLGRENLPAIGEKYFIVCNHQNCVNDPLNILFALPLGCRTGAMARANVFYLNPPITKFLHWIGLVPAYRLGWEGVNGLSHNFDSFDMVAERVNEGRPFFVFPQAGHTQGHYISRFTTGTVRIAFHVAKSNNWKEDIKIVPSAFHYEDFFKLPSDFLLRFSEPISLQPYYERFQTHPNSVLREITHLLHDRIQSMMLDEGIDDYAEKDFLRTSALNPASTANIALPEHLEEDKRFIASLLANEHYSEIISLAHNLKERETLFGFSDLAIHRNSSLSATFLRLLAMLIALPLWLVCLFPHIISYRLPLRMLHEDIMFTNSYRFIVNVLFLYPLLFIVSVIVGSLMGLWWQTLIWILLWIPCMRFALAYHQFAKKTFYALRWNIASSKTKKEILELRHRISALL